VLFPLERLHDELRHHTTVAFLRAAAVQVHIADLDATRTLEVDVEDASTVEQRSAQIRA